MTAETIAAFVTSRFYIDIIWDHSQMADTIVAFVTSRFYIDTANSENYHIKVEHLYSEKRRNILNLVICGQLSNYVDVKYHT